MFCVLYWLWTNLHLHCIPEEHGINLSVILVFICNFSDCCFYQINIFTDRKDVFKLPEARPLGLVLFARWSVIKEWSVLYPGKISAFVIAELRLLLVKKKSKRQWISGLLLLQVSLLMISGLESRQMSIRSSGFIIFWTSFKEFLWVISLPPLLSFWTLKKKKCGLSSFGA